ncbi:Integrase, catalytic core [Thalictrum thalictroides]|uniref:Integrase, catalytic core n=1 Tax=Thalictrum thalictroides TaxID=46969 RepID=A0A7J6WQS4_THATH|nr:Integrase, catalytic core [Thalictrum thalictroides]
MASSSSSTSESSTSSSTMQSESNSLAPSPAPTRPNGPYVSLSAPNVGDFIKLNDSNYMTWLRQMEPFLNGHDFMKYVDGSYPPPVQFIDGIRNPDYVSWYQTDQLVVNDITSTLTESILALVVGTTTSRSAWGCLAHHFAQQSVVNAANIRFQLLSLSKGSQTVSDYLQHAKKLADSLAAIGEPVSNIDLVTSILRGLGSDFDMIVTVILNFPPLPQYEDLRARLLSFETQRAHSPSIGSHQTTLLTSQFSPAPTSVSTPNRSDNQSNRNNNSRNKKWK